MLVGARMCVRVCVYMRGCAPVRAKNPRHPRHCFIINKLTLGITLGMTLGRLGIAMFDLL